MENGVYNKRAGADLTKMKTLAFDVYGTLIDTNGVTKALAQHTSDPQSFARLWRAKQLEYSFRRGLMKRYVHFAECTRQALIYTAGYYAIDLNDAEQDALMDVYGKLPAFTDVAPALADLRALGYPMFAFSNGAAAEVKELLHQADLTSYFRQIVSVEAVASFKPDPAVYAHFLTQAGSQAEETHLISSNPFDVLGGLSFGMQAIWIKRDPKAIFDPWGMEPVATLSDLTELPRVLKEH